MGMLDFLLGGDVQAAQQPPASVAPQGQLPLGAQLNGLDPSVAAAPPKTPEELQQKKSEWGQFIDRINSDPQLQLAVIRMGTNMMQPVQPGQTVAGHLGKSLEDSVSYLGGLREAKTKQAQTERELSLKERKGEADITQTGAQTRQTEQTTQQNTQLFPNKLKQIELELKQLEAQQATWTPEQAAKAVQLKNDLLQAQIDQAKSHSKYYDAAAGLATGKETGARKVQTTKLDDGTLITVTSDKGGTYYTRVIPPKFNTPEEARAAAEKVVQKKTPWFFGKPGYEGTAEQEIARLTAEWTKPGVFHYDQNTKPISALPPDPDAAPVASGGVPGQDRKLSTRDKNLKGAAVVEPGTVVDYNDRDAILRDTLVDTIRQLGKEKPGSPRHQGLLEAKTEIEAKLQASASYGTNQLVQGPDSVAVDTPAPAGAAKKPVGPSVIKVERGPDGKLALPSSAVSDERSPGMLSRMKTGVENSRVTQAQAKLPEILAKQKAKIPLTTADKANLAALGLS